MTQKMCVQLSVEGDTVTLSVESKAEKTEDKEEGGVKWHRVERSSQFQRRALRLPETADLDKVSATMENGILSVDIPKKAVHEPAAKRIAIA